MCSVRCVKYCFEFCCYVLLFCVLVWMVYGVWIMWEGLIVWLSDEVGWSGFGEVVLIVWFGMEMVDEIEVVCWEVWVEVDDEWFGVILEVVGLLCGVVVDVWEMLSV